MGSNVRDIAGPALFLLPTLALLSQPLQASARKWVRRQPAAIFWAPVLLFVVFSVAAWRAGAWSLTLGLMVLGYTMAPTLCVALTGSGGEARWIDLAAILLLWLPLEFGAGARLVPRHAQGYLHAVAYGVAILLALWLFLICRGWKGMKYNLPRGVRDFVNPLVGFAIVAPVLIGVGLAIGFLNPPHAPHFAWSKLGWRYLAIFCSTALPEEILFRGLIQNWLMQRFGGSNWTLLAAGVIFGCSHLNNGPQAVPNWRYSIAATIAGVAFGKVFQKSNSLLSSASLHALVNTVKYAFF